jgi:plasmid stability protein
MAAMDTFRMLETWGGRKYLGEGWRPRSPQVREILRRLTAPENRAALRAWYVRAGRDINPDAARFRQYLADLTGEKLRPEEKPRGEAGLPS